MTPKALIAPRLFDGDAFVEQHAVIVAGTRIDAVVPQADIPAGVEPVKLDRGFLAPGYVDVQVNGGGGTLLNEEPTVAGVRRIAESHRRFGTVGLMPTVITDAPSVLAKAIAAVGAARAAGVPGVLGIHIEGPFLDVTRKGAHAARFIRELAMEDVDTIAAADCGAIMLTLAPNRATPQLVEALARRGVLVSLGHSDASFAEAKAAVAAGARAFTHLYNAMSQLAGREPGMVGAALESPGSYVGVIADGHHVHDAALRVAFAAKPARRMMLISDAMPSAAGGPDRFELQGRTVMRKAGRLSLDDGTLAGSDLTMDAAVRYCVGRLGLRLEDTLRMASRTPAEFLRRGDALGRIAPGFDASLVHLDDDLNVIKTWIDGT
jgi:N-acetylglucosamine-6-phosphate deacetylase